jgi:transposase
MYHWAARRIEAHVKICVLALLMERLAEISCGQSWHRIRRGLEELQISYFSTAEHAFYRTNELTSKVRSLLKTPKIPLPKPSQGIEKHTQNL